MSSSEDLSCKEESLQNLELGTQANLSNVKNGVFDLDDGRNPTEEELATLRRVSGKVPLRCWMVSFIGLTERFAFYGTTVTFQNYMQYSPTNNPQGMLSMGSSTATSINFAWRFWAYICPVLGAYLADTFWGKFKTVMIFAIGYVIGLALLFVTSLPVIVSRVAHMVGFFVSIIIIGCCTGAIYCNASPLVADQIDRHRPYIKVLKSGEKVIVDSALTVQRAISIFYLMTNVGSASCLATTFMELRIGFWAAYLLPLCFVASSFSLIFLGRKMYVKVPVSDKIISKCIRISGIAIKNKGNFEAAKPSLIPEANFPWTDHFVDEVSRALYACKVFLLFPFFWLVMNQMGNNLITQAGQMRLYGLPNDVLTVFNAASVVILVPLFDSILYPFIRRFTPFRAITRITWGFGFLGLAMIYAGVLQHFINRNPACMSNPANCTDPNLHNRAHVAIQAPAYVIIAIAEVLLAISGIEYAYTKAPASMKTFIMAIYLLTNAFGSLIGIALGPVSVPLKLVWTFCSLGIACFIVSIIFWLCFKHYNYQEEKLGTLDFAAEDEKEAAKQDEEIVVSIEPKK